MKQIRKSEYFKINVITTLLCLIPFIIGGIFYGELPARVAVHFDRNNLPDGYASKQFALFGIPAILLAVQVVVCIATELDPKRQNASRGMQVLGRVIIPVLSTLVQCAVILFAMNKAFDLTMIIYVFLGFLFLVIGNLLPKCKYNYTIGIRIPTTLANEENWNKTHRLAGFIWVICSLIILACTFLKQYSYVWVMLVLMVGIPMVYSVVYAIRNKE